jgi:hypothetical protein
MIFLHLQQNTMIFPRMTGRVDTSVFTPIGGNAGKNISDEVNFPLKGIAKEIIKEGDDTKIIIDGDKTFFEKAKGDGE